MRIKILLLGNNPISLIADSQLLRERGMMVFSAFNFDNIEALAREIKPDLVFFDPENNKANSINDAYNNFVNNFQFAHIPVIFTLAEDDVYLVTRKRTDTKNKRKLVADNIIDAVKMALNSYKTYEKKIMDIPASLPGTATPGNNKSQKPKCL